MIDDHIAEENNEAKNATTQLIQYLLTHPEKKSEYEKYFTISKKDVTPKQETTVKSTNRPKEELVSTKKEESTEETEETDNGDASTEENTNENENENVKENDNENEKQPAKSSYKKIQKKRPDVPKKQPKYTKQKPPSPKRNQKRSAEEQVSEQLNSVGILKGKGESRRLTIGKALLIIEISILLFSLDFQRSIFQKNRHCLYILFICRHSITVYCSERFRFRN